MCVKFPNIKFEVNKEKFYFILESNDETYEDEKTVYLFIVPEEGIDFELFKQDINNKLKNILQEEIPEEVYLIQNKPVSHFKVNRKILRRDYNISTNNK